MLSGIGSNGAKREEPAAAPTENGGNSPFGLGSILSALTKNNQPGGGQNPPPAPAPQKAAEPAAPAPAGERVKIDVNPLISAMKSHDDFIKRVNGKQKK